MRWTALNDQGDPIEGTVPDVGVTSGQFRDWLTRKGYTDIDIDDSAARTPQAHPDHLAGDRAPARRAPAGSPPPGAPTCAARCLTYNGNHPFDPSQVTDAERDEWEFCDRPESDPAHGQTLDDAERPPAEDSAEQAPPRRTFRRNAVRPPGTPGSDPYRHLARLTHRQRELYDDVSALGGHDGRDLADVLDEADARPGDKAAVADALGGHGAGDKYRQRQTRAERRIDEAADGLDRAAAALDRDADDLGGRGEPADHPDMAARKRVAAEKVRQYADQVRDGGGDFNAADAAMLADAARCSGILMAYGGRSEQDLATLNRLAEQGHLVLVEKPGQVPFYALAGYGG